MDEEPWSAENVGQGRERETRQVPARWSVRRVRDSPGEPSLLLTIKMAQLPTSTHVLSFLFILAFLAALSLTFPPQALS